MIYNGLGLQKLFLKTDFESESLIQQLIPDFITLIRTGIGPKIVIFTLCLNE